MGIPCRYSKGWLEDQDNEYLKCIFYCAVRTVIFLLFGLGEVFFFFVIAVVCLYFCLFSI